MPNSELKSSSVDNEFLSGVSIPHQCDWGYYPERQSNSRLQRQMLSAAEYNLQV